MRLKEAIARERIRNSLADDFRLVDAKKVLHEVFGGWQFMTKRRVKKVHQKQAELMREVDECIASIIHNRPRNYRPEVSKQSNAYRKLARRMIFQALKQTNYIAN
jgi:hypothetical protein